MVILINDLKSTKNCYFYVSTIIYVQFLKAITKLQILILITRTSNFELYVPKTTYVLCFVSRRYLLLFVYLYETGLTLTLHFFNVLIF